MTVIVQQPTDSNGNPQPMVYDQDTGKIIVDSNGYVINGGKRLVNVPTKADYVSTAKTTTAGIQEAVNYSFEQTIKNFQSYASNNTAPAQMNPIIRLSEGTFVCADDINVTYTLPSGISAGTFGFTLIGAGHQATFIGFSQKNANGIVFDNTINWNDFIFEDVAFQQINDSCNSLISITGEAGNINQLLMSNVVCITKTGTNTPVNGGLYNNASNVYAVNCIFLGENVINCESQSFVASNCFINWSNSTTGSISVSSIYLASCMVGGKSIEISSSLMASATEFDPIPQIILNGNIIFSVKNSAIDTISASPIIVNNSGSTGALQILELDTVPYYSSSDFDLIASGISINNIVIRNIKSTGNGIMSYPVNTPATPSVPASGTAQENTNPYPVDVYMYGGTVTEIQITKNGTAYTVFSNSTGLALSGQAYKLNPGDSITVTYTTAPTWEWLSD